MAFSRWVFLWLFILIFSFKMYLRRRKRKIVEQRAAAAAKRMEEEGEPIPPEIKKEIRQARMERIYREYYKNTEEK